MIAEAGPETLDPRIRRTRQLLQDALEKLLKIKDFDSISVQEIADAATVNRATFYDHYTDKFALLECMVGSRFHELLAERDIRFEGCGAALKATALAVCDYLAGSPGMQCQPIRQLEPHMESAIIAVVRRSILQGLRLHPPKAEFSPEMIAATVSWAIYGAAQEWIKTPDRSPAEKVAEAVTALISPMLAGLYAGASPAPAPTSA